MYSQMTSLSHVNNSIPGNNKREYAFNCHASFFDNGVKQDSAYASVVPIDVLD